MHHWSLLWNKAEAPKGWQCPLWRTYIFDLDFVRQMGGKTESGMMERSLGLPAEKSNLEELGRGMKVGSMGPSNKGEGLGTAA